jgi:hypothetical protein
MTRSLGLLLPLALACAPTAPVAPVADAGSLVIGAPGQPFQLDGASSSGEEIQLRWALIDGPEDAALLHAETPWPVLIPNAEGVYLLGLTVCDARGACDEAQTAAVVGATAHRQRALRGAALGGLFGGFGGPSLGGFGGPKADNHAPEAQASAQRSLAATSSVKLDGRASSDPDGDTLRYRWRFVSRPAGSALTNDDIVNGADAQANFTADVEGVWQVQLTVRDHSLGDTVVLPEIILKSLHDDDPIDDLSAGPGLMRWDVAAASAP